MDEAHRRLTGLQRYAAGVSTFWHPDPEIAFWQSRAGAGDPAGAPERPGDGLAPAAPGDGDPEPAAGALEPPAIDVTPLESPSRVFLPARALTPEEEAEFRRDWEDLDDWISAGLLGPLVLPGMTAPAPPPRDAGPCQNCGLGDLPPDDAGRCVYCAELAALKARNLPGPPLSRWWLLVPGVLALGLGLMALWALLYVVFYAL